MNADGTLLELIFRKASEFLNPDELVSLSYGKWKLETFEGESETIWIYEAGYERYHGIQIDISGKTIESNKQSITLSEVLYLLDARWV